MLTGLSTSRRSEWGISASRCFSLLPEEVYLVRVRVRGWGEDEGHIRVKG